jgi:hypothetical protein
MAAGVHQRLYKVLFFMYTRKLLTIQPKKGNVVGDGFKMMFYNISKYKVFDAHLLPCIRQYSRSFSLCKTILIAVFLLSMVSFSYAETEITEGYDENTEITIRGTVIEIMHGMRGPVILKLKTGIKTYNVVTAPGWYLSRNAITFSIGTALEVTGSRYFGRDGNLYVIARQIRDAETGSVTVLRDSYCKPLWRGGHRMHDRRLP